MEYPQEAVRLYVQADQIITGKKEEPIKNGVVKLKDGKIECVYTQAQWEALESKEELPFLDAKGCTIMPGMIDCHVHMHGYSLQQNFNIPLWFTTTPQAMKLLHAAKNCRHALECGFTSLRNMGMIGGEDLLLRDAINMGVAKGPRLFTTGPEISMTAGHGHLGYLNLPHLEPVDGVENCRKAVRQRVAMKADFIKTHASGGMSSDGDKFNWRNYTLEEMSALVDEAHELDRRVAVHAQGTKGIRISLQAGVDSIEHGVFLDEECIQMMLDQGTFLVPTLIISNNIAKQGRKLGAPEGVVLKAEKVYAAHVDSIQRAYKAGVKIAMGTDAANYCKLGESADEIINMVEIGISPMDAIIASTLTAADCIGIADMTGSIEAGKLADVIVVKGDPLEDVSILRQHDNILLVFKEGVLSMDRMHKVERW